MDKNADVTDEYDPNRKDIGRAGDPDSDTDDDRDDAVIAADDTGMISNERTIVHENIEDASEP